MLTISIFLSTEDSNHRLNTKIALGYIKDSVYGVMIFDMSKSKETNYETISILETIADLFTASIVKYV